MRGTPLPSHGTTSGLHMALQDRKGEKGWGVLQSKDSQLLLESPGNLKKRKEKKEKERKEENQC